MMWTQLSGYLIDCKKLRKTLVVNSEVSFLQTKFFFSTVNYQGNLLLQISIEWPQ